MQLKRVPFNSQQWHRGFLFHNFVIYAPDSRGFLRASDLTLCCRAAQATQAKTRQPIGTVSPLISIDYLLGACICCEWGKKAKGWSCDNVLCLWCMPAEWHRNSHRQVWSVWLSHWHCATRRDPTDQTSTSVVSVFCSIASLCLLLSP